jgi:hypothetical protein
VPSLQASLEGTVNIADSWGNGPGGAFQITVASTVGNSAAVNQIKHLQNPFISFCIERNEYVVNGGAKLVENWRFEIPFRATQNSDSPMSPATDHGVT